MLPSLISAEEEHWYRYVKLGRFWQTLNKFLTIPHLFKPPFWDPQPHYFPCQLASSSSWFVAQSRMVLWSRVCRRCWSSAARAGMRQGKMRHGQWLLTVACALGFLTRTTQTRDCCSSHILERSICQDLWVSAHATDEQIQCSHVMIWYGFLF